MATSLSSTRAAVRARRPFAAPAVPRPADPSRAEREFVSALNAARANPARFGQVIGVRLDRVRPAAMLAVDVRLSAAAARHAADMVARRYFSHDTPEGTDPGRQVGRCGYGWVAWGQSIAAGYDTAAAALAALIEDAGHAAAGHPHRRHLLSVGPEFVTHTAVGVGVAKGGPFGTVWVVNTGCGPAPARVQDRGHDEFVGRLFRAELGRDPTPPELDHWSAEAAATGRGPVAAAVAGTPEAAAARVVEWFVRILGRSPTRGEVKGYAAAVGRVPDEQVQARIAALADTSDPRAWAEAVHRAATGREPTTDELKHVEYYVREKGPARYARSLFESGEARAMAVRQAAVFADDRQPDDAAVERAAAAPAQRAARLAFLTA